jgi:hypothetical protein
MAGGRAAVAGFPPFSLPNFVLFLSTTTQQEWRTEHVLLASSVLLEGVAASMASRQPSGIGDASFLGPKAKSLLGSVAKPVCFTLWRMAQYDYVASRFFRKLINKLAGYPHIYL